MFSCAVQEGVLVMGQAVGVFIRFSSYWQQPSPRCLPSWHPIAKATQQRSWPSESRSDSARSHRRYASPLIDLKRANSSASQAECRGFDPLHPLWCITPHVIAQRRTTAGFVFTVRLRLKGSLFALARTEIPLFRALVAVVGAARAGRSERTKKWLTSR